MEDNRRSEKGGGVQHADTETLEGLSILSFIVSRFLRSYLTGFNLFFISFAILAIPEAFRIFRSHPDNSVQVYWLALSIITGSGFLYATVFHAILLSIRTADIFFSRFGRIWTYGAPGFVAFIVFLEIPLRHLIFGDVRNPALPVSAALFVLILLGLLFLLPPFSGINATILFFSAVFSRALLLPVENELVAGMNTDFVLFLIRLTLLIAVFYLLIHIRYRHLLSPYLEPYAVSTGSVILACSLSIAFTILCSLSMDQGFAENEWARFADSQLEFLTVSSWSWFLTALMIQWDLYRKRDSVIGQFLLFFFLISSAALSFVLIHRYFPETTYGTAIVRTGGISANLISLPAHLLDTDNDGNSFWPGGDPDDGNACIRSDYICEPDTRKEEALQVPRSASGRKNIVLISIVARAKLISPSLTGSDDTPRSLRALFQNLNGMQEYSGRVRRSLLSVLSEAGYRTICGGTDGGKGYMETSARYGLDSGCQVFIGSDNIVKMMESGDGGGPSFRDTLRAMRTAKKKYAEKRDLVWIHHESEREGSEEFFLESAASAISEAGFLTGKEAVYVLIANPPFVNYYLYNDNNLIKLSTFESLAAELIKAAGLPGDLLDYQPGPTVLYRNAPTETAAGDFAQRLRSPPRLPAQTLILENGVPTIWDGIYGIRIPWDEIHQGEDPTPFNKSGGIQENY